MADKEITFEIARLEGEDDCLESWQKNHERFFAEEGKKVDAVVVKKGGEPMIYKTKDYTMVVAIDCVKIGFIFRNGKNVTA